LRDVTTPVSDTWPPAASVERRRRKDQLALLPGLEFVHRLLIPDHRRHVTFDLQWPVGFVDHAARRSLLLQALQDPDVDRSGVGGRLARRAEAGGLAVLLHRLSKAGLVDLQTSLPSDVARDLERESEGGVQVKGSPPFEAAAVLSRGLSQQCVEPGQTGVDGPLEALFLFGDRSLDRRLVAGEFGVDIAVLFDDGPGDFGQERPVEAGLCSETAAAADDHPADVIAPGVARDDSVGDQESRGAAVVGNDAVGRPQLPHLIVGVTQPPLDGPHDRLEEVRLVIGRHALEHRDQPLEAHAGVDMLLWQGLERCRAQAVVLNEDQVPQLNEALAVAIQPADMPRHALLVAGGRAAVDVDLAVRTARADLGHLPEVLAAAKEGDVGRIETRLLAPQVGGFVVTRDVALVVGEARGVEVLPGQPPVFRQQLPGPRDGFGLVVVAEGPVAQHFEEGLVDVVASDVIQVIVFAGDAHALLRVDRPQVRAAAGPEEDVLELDHPRVGEEQRRIGGRNERRRVDDGVLALRKEVQERLATSLWASPVRTVSSFVAWTAGHYAGGAASTSGR
jgi:hypothetical protein